MVFPDLSVTGFSPTLFLTKETRTNLVAENKEEWSFFRSFPPCPYFLDHWFDTPYLLHLLLAHMKSCHCFSSTYHGITTQKTLSCKTLDQKWKQIYPVATQEKCIYGWKYPSKESGAYSLVLWNVLWDLNGYKCQEDSALQIFSGAETPTVTCSALSHGTRMEHWFISDSWCKNTTY